MRITKENTIGLIIDIQERLVPAMFEKETLLKNCQVLISGLNELGIQLIVTQQYTKGLGETAKEISEVIPGFNYIEKRDFSCCDEPVFAEKLKDLSAKNIIICGIESHVCVLQPSCGDGLCFIACSGQYRNCQRAIQVGGNHDDFLRIRSF